MTVDTAASPTDAGLTNLDGTLPTDQLGTPAATPSGQPDLGETEQQKIDAETALAAQIPVTSSTTTDLSQVGTPGSQVGPIDPSVYAYAGGNASIGNKIVTAAEHYLNTPYAWGGTSAAGVDCSGLVYLAYKAAGIDLPRVSYEQADKGVQVSSWKNLRPGDLVAWDNSQRNPGADHISVYLGNGYIIEAAHPGTNVRIRKLGADEKAMYIRMGW